MKYAENKNSARITRRIKLKTKRNNKVKRKETNLNASTADSTALLSPLPPLGTGDVAALVRSHMDGLQPFESTIEKTTEKCPYP